MESLVKDCPGNDGPDGGLLGKIEGVIPMRRILGFN